MFGVVLSNFACAMIVALEPFGAFSDMAYLMDCKSILASFYCANYHVRGHHIYAAYSSIERNKDSATLKKATGNQGICHDAKSKE